VSLIVISLYVALRFEWKFTVPVLIALMHDLLITAGVYALTGRVVTADTVAALLTILGYSLYDTIIVFDRVRENIPRMPRAAFSQIVNRSMSEVLTRSLITTSCTLLPIIALLLFGGSELKDFAFALLIGVASGAYSSIFIASPVLTHWKEREHAYKARHARILETQGFIPAYADGGDIEPQNQRARKSPRLSGTPDDGVSSDEFEQMKRDLGLEDETPPTGRRRLSRVAESHAHTTDEQLEAPEPPRPPSTSGRTPIPTRTPMPPAPVATPDDELIAEQHQDQADQEFEQSRTDPTPSAADEAENGGVADVRSGPTAPKRGNQRNRRHGRKR
jgi:SecD/SecF fusion protein